jgi:ribosomal protein S18 acetylase RimI-like enzyme
MIMNSRQTMNLDAQRASIRPLIDETKPADALASYYANYHADQKTSLVLQPPDANIAQGYIALSRTGMDLFRPLLTMRLPSEDEATAELMERALPVNASAILIVPETYTPILKALFEMQSERRLRVLILDHGRFQPVINVLVTEEKTPDGLPRFVIRSRQENNHVVASANINWQTSTFADISVSTESDQRRQGWGRSVAAALCQQILDSGRTPLYSVDESNQPSLKLAESVGFIDLGIRKHLFQGTRRQVP